MRNGSPALFVSASVTLRNQFVFFCVVICRGLWNAPTLHTAAVERLCAESERSNPQKFRKSKLILRHRRASKTMVSGIDCGLICFCVFG